MICTNSSPHITSVQCTHSIYEGSIIKENKEVNANAKWTYTAAIQIRQTALTATVRVGDDTLIQLELQGV